jgi:hypothetical protein
MVRINGSYRIHLSLKSVLVLGNFVYANLMGTPVFVIGDREVANELLNVRGKMSASRPPNVLALELCVAFPLADPLLTSHAQNGLGGVEFGIDSARKDTLRGTVYSTESHHARCRWFVSTFNRSKQPPVPQECVRNGNGWRPVVFDPPVRFLRFTTAPHFTRDYRGVGKLIVRITYADALSKKEASDLIKQNEETVRLTAEAVAKVYLVNIIPLRTSIYADQTTNSLLVYQLNISLLGSQAPDSSSWPLMSRTSVTQFAMALGIRSSRI